MTHFSKFTIPTFAASALLLLGACESEKDLIIITDDLPIKTSTLYMVGNATPAGWDIGNPTPLAAEGEDPLLFEWEGRLNQGEMKLCLQPGSWDVGFIRPIEDQEPIGADPIENQKFCMNAGDPDKKWVITTSGTYHLTFDLRHWTMSSICLQSEAPSEPDTPPTGGDTEPIETPTLFMVGDATPAGWNIDAPQPLEKTGDYIFEYTGELNPGEMKACASPGSWDVEFIRPLENGERISSAGLETGFQYHAGDPDEKWVVADRGNYHLTFDLSARTFKAEYLGEITVEKTPFDTATLYMIGDATPNGWSMDDPTPFNRQDTYIFTWEGILMEGHFKVCLAPDGTYSCPFIRPLRADVVIDTDGVEEPDFVYTTGPDDQWVVKTAGRYRLTFDLEAWTINAEYLAD